MSAMENDTSIPLASHHESKEGKAIRDSKLGDIEVNTSRGAKVQLRQMEGEVKVSEILRKKSFSICREFVEAYALCAANRLFSVAWACRGQRDMMRICLERAQGRPELIEESLAEYEVIRAKFQEYYRETGNTVMPEELRD